MYNLYGMSEIESSLDFQWLPQSPTIDVASTKREKGLDNEDPLWPLVPYLVSYRVDEYQNGMSYL